MNFSAIFYARCCVFGNKLLQEQSWNNQWEPNVVKLMVKSESKLVIKTLHDLCRLCKKNRNFTREIITANHNSSRRPSGSRTNDKHIRRSSFFNDVVDGRKSQNLRKCEIFRAPTTSTLRHTRVTIKDCDVDAFVGQNFRVRRSRRGEKWRNWYGCEAIARIKINKFFNYSALFTLSAKVRSASLSRFPPPLSRNWCESIARNVSLGKLSSSCFVDFRWKLGAIAALLLNHRR